MTDLLVDAIATAVLAKIKPLLDAGAQVKARLMTIEQAAVYLGRTATAVRCLITKDAFPSVKADGRVMLDVRDLDRWIEQNKG